MNQQQRAKENQLFVSTLLLMTQHDYATDLNVAVLVVSKELEPVIVGFGACETPSYPAHQEDWDLS